MFRLNDFANVKDTWLQKGWIHTKESEYQNINGMPWAHIGGKHKGEFAIVDSNIIEQNLETKNKNRIQVVKKAYLDENNQPLKNIIMNLNGEAYRVNKNGCLPIINGNDVKNVLKETAMREKRYHDIAKMFQSVEIMATLLQITHEKVDELCQKGGLKKVMDTQYDTGLDTIDEVNCSPFLVNNYPPGSTLEAQARTKLVMIARLFNPVIANMDESEIDVVPLIQHYDKPYVPPGTVAAAAAAVGGGAAAEQ